MEYLKDDKDNYLATAWQAALGSSLMELSCGRIKNIDGFFFTRKAVRLDGKASDQLNKERNLIKSKSKLACSEAFKTT